jgi:hypothetical protein
MRVYYVRGVCALHAWIRACIHVGGCVACVRAHNDLGHNAYMCACNNASIDHMNNTYVGEENIDKRNEIQDVGPPRQNLVGVYYLLFVLMKQGHS